MITFTLIFPDGFSAGLLTRFPEKSLTLAFAPVRAFCYASWDLKDGIPDGGFLGGVWIFSNVLRSMHYFDKPFLLELLWGTAQRRFQGYFDISTQKFFRAVQTSKIWNSQYYSMFLQGFRVHHLPLKGVSKRKNRHLVTFLQIKTVSGVMRWCYLFLQIPMIMKKCLQT